MRLPLRGLGTRALAWTVLLPATSLAATLAVVLHRIPLLVAWVQNSDSVGPMLIAEAVGHIPHGARVTMASEGNLSIVGLDVLTRGVPGHRTLWLALPFVLQLAATALLAATVRALAGWRAAVLCAAIAVATPPLMLAPLLSQAFHNTAFFLLVVTGSVLVWQARADNPLTPWRLAGCALLGVAGGIELLSDHLYFIGLAALVGGGGLLWLQRRDRRSRDVAAVAAAVAALAVVVWRIASWWAVHANVHAGAQPASPAGLHRIADNLRLLREVLLTMVNGRSTAPGPQLLRIVCTALGAAALLVAAWALVRVVLRRHPATGRSAEDDAGRTVWIAYWGAIATLLLAAFVFSQIPVNISAIRYLVPVLWALAAVVPLVVSASRLSMAFSSAAVAVVGLYGAVVLTVAPQGDFQEPQDADVLASTLQKLHVDHGYAGYWQGDMLTWQSEGRVVSRAVVQSPICGATEPGWFCPYTVNTVASWFAPSGTGPSFLIVEDGSIYLPASLPAMPKPRQVLRVDRFTVYVFDEDIGGFATVRTAGWWPAAGG